MGYVESAPPLNKRNTELKTSRDLWKSKYQAGELSAEKTVALESPKARHHQYSVHVVMLVMHLQNYGKMSLRSCRHRVSSLWEIQTKNLSQYSP